MIFMKFTTFERHYNATCQGINLEQVLGIVPTPTGVMTSPSIFVFYLYLRVTQNTTIRLFHCAPENRSPITYTIAKYDISPIVITIQHEESVWNFRSYYNVNECVGRLSRPLAKSNTFNHFNTTNQFSIRLCHMRCDLVWVSVSMFEYMVRTSFS